MQPLNKLPRGRLRFRGDRPVAEDRTLRRRELRLGLIGAATVVSVLAACGILYALPLGKVEYRADLSESGAIRPGEDVRVAGINVGTVESLELHDDRVHMVFTVDSDVFVGDQSTLDIRMLTIAGGHFVALTPAGSKPLGKKVIAKDRVRLPYTLGQAFQDAITPLREVDGEVLRDNLGQLQAALVESPDGLRQLGRAVDSVVDILHQQNMDVSRALAVSQEYLSRISGNTALYGRLNSKLNLTTDILVDKRAELRVSLALLARLLSRIAAAEPAYGHTMKPMLDELAEAIPGLERLTDRLDQVIDSVQSIGQQLQQIAGPDGYAVDQSKATVSAPALCIPVPGRSC
ncbi:MlaD family protein [Nocardia gipuzkoensis]|uniref:MlaD family protein n=1 Tax=Nocardia gipuzkoensis TaxID=2749991 RepID=UPI001E3657CA|nr:MlaD family protein [Nocardia gipuzkoensis]UGT67899.1 MlaD family protein [Nocardia gipuzkoensis]